MLHEDGQTSNMKQALSSFDFNDDGKIDFQEFTQLNAQFPSLLYPAFRIQQNMRIYTMGESWWRRKIEELHRDKVEQLAKLQAQNEAGGGDGAAQDTDKQAKEVARKAKLKRQEQAVRIRMGCCMFYCCPCRRHKYVIDESAPSDDEDEDEDGDSEKAKRKRAAEEAAKRRQQQALGKKDRRDNIVKISGPRKPLSKEERLERARKRRLRDMADRPTRKG
ncbi:hypothetical protein PINS_up011561 [Pythium insidiosum]|nr:hypothetical protein PINS_up011561 [Pythium insidiosum]